MLIAKQFSLMFNEAKKLDKYPAHRKKKQKLAEYFR